MLFAHLSDPTFRDFNFSAIWDPSLRRGPSFEALFKLVYQARQGDRSGSVEFGDTIYCTLRPAAFEAYQRAHGPRAFGYPEWFYAKVKMFFEVLLYDRLEIIELTADKNFQTRAVEQPWREGVKGFSHHVGDWVDDELIAQTLVPEDNERVGWPGLVHEVSAVKTNRTEFLREWLRRQPAERNAASRKPKSWGKNRARDEIILNGLQRDMDRAEICKELDKRNIPTLPGLQKLDFKRWTDAWQEAVGRQSIQQLFSKLPKSLKFRTLSK